MAAAEAASPGGEPGGRRARGREGEADDPEAGWFPAPHHRRRTAAGPPPPTTMRTLPAHPPGGSRGPRQAAGRWRLLGSAAGAVPRRRVNRSPGDPDAVSDNRPQVD